MVSLYGVVSVLVVVPGSWRRARKGRPRIARAVKSYLEDEMRPRKCNIDMLGVLGLLKWKVTRDLDVAS